MACKRKFKLLWRQFQLVLTTFFYLPVALCVQIHPSDVAALLAVKSELNNDVLNILSTWSSANTTCEQWVQVRCDQSGRVTSLDLSYYPFGGSISPHIGNLTALTLLSMGNGAISGAIPSTIGKLVNLQTLSFSTLKLTGSIPASISNLKNLTSLTISNTALNSPFPPLENLTRLTDLDLYQANVYGVIPPFITSLIDLTKLDLSSNNLSGPIPSEIGNLVGLEFLMLAGNRLNGTIPLSMGNLVKLSELKLSDNHLTGNIPATFANLTKLRSIELSGNNLTGSIPTFFGDLPDLSSTIDLSSNQLTGEIPPNIGNLASLSNVNLSNNLLTGVIPQSISNMESLLIFSVANNYLTGSLELNFTLNVQNLDFSSNFFSGRLRVLDNSTGVEICPTATSDYVTFSNGLRGNCFLSAAALLGTCPPGRQRAPAACARFCNASAPEGACGGRGVCAPNGGGEGGDSCSCEEGYGVTAEAPFECVAVASSPSPAPMMPPPPSDAILPPIIVIAPAPLRGFTQSPPSSNSALQSQPSGSLILMAAVAALHAWALFC